MDIPSTEMPLDRQIIVLDRAIARLQERREILIRARYQQVSK